MASRGREWRLLICGLVGSDLLAVAAAFALAYRLRFESDFPAPVHSKGFYLAASLAVVLLFVAVFSLHNLYNPEYLLGGPREYANVVHACTYGMVAVIWTSFFYGRVPLVSRGWLVIAWLLSILFVGLARFSIRRVVYRLRRSGAFTVNAIIAGANEQGLASARQLSPASASGLQVVGFVDDFLPMGTSVGGGLRVLGPLSSLRAHVSRQRVGEVLVVPQAMPWESLNELVRQVQSYGSNTRLRLTAGLYDVAVSSVEVTRIGSLPVLTMNSRSITGPDRWLKAALDMAVSAGLLVLSFPLLVGLVAYLKWVLRIPPIENIGVVGRAGRLFQMRVLATMQHDDDPLARWVNRCRLRRLPALWNVFVREMSMVGPQPMPPADFSSALCHYAPTVLSVRPGLTGLGQISVDESSGRLPLDLYYVRNYSIWLDLQALFKTLQLMLKDLARGTRSTAALRLPRGVGLEDGERLVVS